MSRAFFAMLDLDYAREIGACGGCGETEKKVRASAEDMKLCRKCWETACLLCGHPGARQWLAGSLRRADYGPRPAPLFLCDGCVDARTAERGTWEGVSDGGRTVTRTDAVLVTCGRCGGDATPDRPTDVAALVADWPCDVRCAECSKREVAAIVAHAAERRDAAYSRARKAVRDRGAEWWAEQYRRHGA